MPAKRRGNNEGSIFQRRDGRWTAQVSLPDGNRRTVYAKSRREAVQKCNALLAQLAQLPTDPTRLTLAQWAAEWLAAVRARSAPRTYEVYESRMRRHILPALGTIKLTDLTPRHVQQWATALAGTGLAPRTQEFTLTTLRQCLQAAVRQELIIRNVATFVRLPPAVDTRPVALTPDQSAAVLTACRDHWLLDAAVAVALGCGLRRGEVMGLRWADVDFDSGLLHVRGQVARVPRVVRGEGAGVQRAPTKTGDERVVAMPAFVVAALRRRRAVQAQHRLQAGPAWQEADLVFTSPLGDMKDPRTLTERFARALAKSDLPAIRFHDLRHTAATRWTDLGVPQKTIMAMLGHRDHRMTLRYQHVSEDAIRDAARRLDQAMGK